MGTFVPAVNNRNAAQQQAAYSPNATNFNDWVKYARGAMVGGQIPNNAGYQQYLGPQPVPQPARPVSNIGQLGEIPMQQVSPAPGVSGPPPKLPRNLQYAAALSRMK